MDRSPSSRYFFAPLPFAPLAKSLVENEQKIVAELLEVQGKPADIGGYFKADEAKVKAVMRPSATFNPALEAFAA